MNEAQVLYPSYIANIVFNAFLAYATIILNIVTVDPRNQKNFVASSSSQNTATQSCCL